MSGFRVLFLLPERAARGSMQLILMEELTTDDDAFHVLTLAADAERPGWHSFDVGLLSRAHATQPLIKRARSGATPPAAGAAAGGQAEDLRAGVTYRVSLTYQSHSNGGLRSAAHSGLHCGFGRYRVVAPRGVPVRAGTGRLSRRVRTLRCGEEFDALEIGPTDDGEHVCIRMEDGWFDMFSRFAEGQPKRVEHVNSSFDNYE